VLGVGYGGWVVLGCLCYDIFTRMFVA
jgi:hypothetical protein